MHSKTHKHKHSKTTNINKKYIDIPTDIINLITSRNTPRRRLQRSFDPNLKTQFNNLNNGIHNRLKTHKTRHGTPYYPHYQRQHTLEICTNI